MLQIYTDNPEQQRQLQLQFSTRNNFYLIPPRNIPIITKMLSSISYEFFQNHIPPVVQKIREMLSNSMNSTYYLSNYRQIMAMIKKERDKVDLFKHYMIEMDSAFAQSISQFDLQNQPETDLAYDEIFNETLKGQPHQPQTLELQELPLFSELKIRCDYSQTKTEKTMQSELCSTAWNESSRSKLSNFFNQSSYSRDDWKTQRKEQDSCKNKSGSKQMSSFRKKGSTILDNNKDLGNILIKQMEYDFTRQMNLAKDIGERRHIEIQKHCYQKKIKDALVNYKLKIRKRK